MKKLFFCFVIISVMSSCASPTRALYDTANNLYGGSWTYITTMVIYPDVLYSDKITTAKQTREIVLHEGLISYEKMLHDARLITEIALRSLMSVSTLKNLKQSGLVVILMYKRS